jgi:hypothetical protein
MGKISRAEQVDTFVGGPFCKLVEMHVPAGCPAEPRMNVKISDIHDKPFPTAGNFQLLL